MQEIDEAEELIKRISSIDAIEVNITDIDKT